MARVSCVRNFAGLVDRLADHVHDASKRPRADRNRNRQASVGHLLTADQAFAYIHGYRAHGRLAEMLGDFEHQAITVVRWFPAR